jgi:hypothetical protein
MSTTAATTLLLERILETPQAVILSFRITISAYETHLAVRSASQFVATMLVVGVHVALLQ